ncbi:hypothetical protein QCB44_01460 [Thiomicrorhabdus sp. zzn3]|uniref:hypothetical protein n=1 Tax=Thiomicrorhabdus sp. zzn3 TaxID=3039775 RepID=UPI002436E1D0|nr:hypothetical protein [Thiomicrorhabdus sp. zzn3]MDG6777365.1 hypothetical protein [Thiomicrorhabdus sp. zzn3]
MMVPSGFYEGYNDLGHMQIGSGINALIQSMEALYLGIIHLDGFEFYIYALSLLLAINLILSAREIYLSRQIKVSAFFRNSGLILLGAGLIALALFPYAFVGKIPVVSGWNDRHFLLVPLGFAIVILFMAKVIYWGRETIVSLAILGIVGLFSYNILLSIYSCLRDGIYQESIMEEFKSNKVFSANNTFLILNKSDTRIFCHDRHVHYYEWNALLRQVYPEANKSINSFETQFKKTMETRFLETFNAKNYVYSEPTRLCFNTRKIGLNDIFSMYFDQNFNYNYVQFSLPEIGAGNQEVCK